jgi:hypothetical protein
VKDLQQAEEILAPKEYYITARVPASKEHAEALAAVEDLHTVFPSRSEILCMLPKDQRAEVLWQMMLYTVEREPQLVDAENRLMVAANDPLYSKQLLWYRKRRGLLIDGFRALVAKSGVKNAAEFLAWSEQMDRLNPELADISLEEIEEAEKLMIGERPKSLPQR